MRPQVRSINREVVALAWVIATSPCCPADAETPTKAQAQGEIVCKVEQYQETLECLQRLKGLVVRTGDTLRLDLSNGRTKVYTSDHVACAKGQVEKCVVHLLLRYYRSLQSFLVMTSFYECGYYEVVNRRTGSVLEISTIPEISPHGKYLVSADDSDACARKYDIAIWSTGTDPPSLEMEYQAAQYENWRVTGWTNDVRFQLKAFVNSRQTSYDQEAEAIRSADGWKLFLGRKSNLVERNPPSKSAVPSWPKTESSPWPQDTPAPPAARPQ